MPATRMSAASVRRVRRARWVAPVFAIAVVLLLGGLWEGLVYLGFALPPGDAELHAAHGPLMVLGFFGAVISLERAVALGKLWGYLAPAAAALGGLAVVVGAPDALGPALVTAGGLVLVGIFAAVHRIQPSMHNLVLASGAACWVVSGVLWLLGWGVPRFVPWLAGFLVLTITGERLELSRLRDVGAGSGTVRRWGLRRVAFLAAAGVFAGGLVLSLVVEAAGVRLAGIGLCALAAWLARYDVARHTVRLRGVTRYMALALLAGYVWLAVGGVMWVVVGRMSFSDLGTGAHGSAYDVMLHAVFLGFVISMIFAHAPVIVPAVLGRRLPYSVWLYVPLVLLHASLLLRILGGDVAGNLASWRWGGVLNETALLLYLALAAALVIRGASRRPPPPRSTASPGSTARIRDGRADGAH